jgi:hypothetical protein
MDFILDNVLATGLVGIGLLIIGWLAGRYVKPWLHAKPKRLETAQEIALIADRLTDELVDALPNATWDDLLNRLVDKLISSLELGGEVAHREAVHQLSKRGLLSKKPKPDIPVE